MAHARGGLRHAVALLLWGLAIALVLFRLAGARLHRYEVRGQSMLPTLAPGDWLLVDRRAYRTTGPRIGDVVVARDPRSPGREILKRVAGRRAGGYWLLGDNPPASTDSRTFGPVPRDLITGKVWFRYAPLRDAGRVH